MSTNYYVPKRSRIYEYKTLSQPFLGNNGKYNYLYKIVNKKNNKYYIGIHSTSNLLDGYSGSGKTLQNSIRKHGSKIFEKIILNYYNNREELINAEKDAVTIKEVSDPNCYNLTIGGNAQIKETHTNQKGMIYIYNNNCQKRIRIFPKDLELYISNGWVKGYGPVSDAVKNSGTKGKKLIHNSYGENKWVDEDDLSFFFKSGWVLGRSIGNNKDKIYIHKDRNDGDLPDRKLIYPKDLKKWVNDGWSEGYGASSDKLKKGTITGRIYITKNNSTKTIFPSELQKYLDEGWVKGVVGFEHHRALIGRKRMYNPNTFESIIVNEFDQQKYLNEGWKYGMGKRAKNKFKSTFIFKDGVYKKININEFQKYLDEGWIKKHPAAGSTQICKDGINKMISVDKPEELQKYLDEGWSLGMKCKQ